MENKSLKIERLMSLEAQLKELGVEIESDASLAINGILSWIENGNSREEDSWGLIIEVTNPSGEAFEVVVECDKKRYYMAQDLLEYMQDYVEFYAGGVNYIQ